MSYGYLKFSVHTGDDALPIANSQITVHASDGKVIYRAVTDQNGNTGAYKIWAPDKKLTLDPNYKKPAYTVCIADISAKNYVTKHIEGIPIVDGQTTIMPVNMQPLNEEDMVVTDEYIDIPPINLLNPAPNRQASPPPPAPTDIAAVPAMAEAATPRIGGSGVLIPDYITVHLGAPTNASARNVRVRFSDYIKNVVSSEIYSTWPPNSLRANINVIVTFALNRVYTEWYRSRGYNFDITSTTSYDMVYRDGGPIFENISILVDDLFNTYARRIGFENPFPTQFCNGTTSTCAGLSQWGTVTLANQGRSPLEILRYYYPNDLELTISNNIGGVSDSFPRYALRVGSEGESVKRMQDFLNRIRINYPLIPEISNPNGVFGNDTAEAVRTFQRTFSMTADGLIGQATWNKITFIFTAVTRLAELDSEGIRRTIGENPPNVILQSGARGENVVQLQFLLNYISVFYPSVPTVLQNSVFDSRTKNAVIEFQKNFSLTTDGIVGPATWNKLYAVYNGIDDNVERPPVPDDGGTEPPTINIPPYPGTPLRIGSRGNDVRTMQAFLNVISTIYPILDKLTADGIFGPETDKKVRQFQKIMGLTVDGIIGPATWNKIVETYLLASGNKPAPLEYPGTPLRVGSRGTNVRLMQGFLQELTKPYPSLPSITVDGIFGPNTEAAVRGFQRLFGLSADGIIGPITWYRIIEERDKAV